MMLNAPTDSETPKTLPIPVNSSADQDLEEGGFPIDTDAGAVDTSGQAHVPPPK